MTTTTEPTDVDRLADVAVEAWNREECVEAGRQAACASPAPTGDAYFRACMAYVVRAVLDAQPPSPQTPAAATLDEDEPPTADLVEPAHFVLPVPSGSAPIAPGFLIPGIGESWGFAVAAREEIRRQQAREHVMRSLRRARATARPARRGRPAGGGQAMLNQRTRLSIPLRTANGAAILTAARLRRAGLVAR